MSRVAHPYGKANLRNKCRQNDDFSDFSQLTGQTKRLRKISTCMPPSSAQRRPWIMQYVVKYYSAVFITPTTDVTITSSDSLRGIVIFGSVLPLPRNHTHTRAHWAKKSSTLVAHAAQRLRNRLQSPIRAVVHVCAERLFLNARRRGPWYTQHISCSHFRRRRHGLSHISFFSCIGQQKKYAPFARSLKVRLLISAKILFHSRV